MNELTPMDMSAASDAASGGADVTPVEQRWYVTLIGHASVSVTVDTTETDPAVIAFMAEEQFEGVTLCHQCAGEVDVEDVWECDDPTGLVWKANKL